MFITQEEQQHLNNGNGKIQEYMINNSMCKDNYVDVKKDFKSKHGLSYKLMFFFLTCLKQV